VKQETPPALRYLERALAEAEAAGLLRTRHVPAATGEPPCFCSNDYLGLSVRPAPSAPSGAGASRLVSGNSDLHEALETASASLVGLPKAIAFTSGYAANLGLLGSVAGPGDVVVSDALNHASIIDGARLSRAAVVVTPHLDTQAVDRALSAPRAGRAFVVTESYFSMDADSPDLAALRRLCDRHEAALIVDEAHALGVLGPEGRGLCAVHGVTPDALVGTYGKAFGAAGAFVAGSAALTSWLWNRARSFVFSTGLSPVVAAAALEGIRTADAEPERRARVATAANRIRGALLECGIRPGGYGHIIPWIVGSPTAAVRAARDLATRGVTVRAIRPPSVPPGAARLRLTVTASHSTADLDLLVHAIRAVAEGAAAASSWAD
jgi:8-amino-7-oxononanoate synthase